MPNGSAKPEPPKIKSKLKSQKFIKQKEKIQNPNLCTRAEEGKEKVSTNGGANGISGSDLTLIYAGPADRQLQFFLYCDQTATKSKLLPLELETYEECCMVELPEGVDQDVKNFSGHIKEAFGVSVKEELCLAPPS